MEITRRFQRLPIVAQFEPRHILATSESYSKFKISGRDWEHCLLVVVRSVRALSLIWNSLSSVLLDLTSRPRSSVLTYYVNLPNSYNFSIISVQYYDESSPL
jgi:hypothetical protein